MVLVFIISLCVAGLTVLITCFWLHVMRQLVGNSLIRGAWHPNCGTSREIGGFHTGFPGKSDLLGSDPVSSVSLRMNTSRYFEPSRITRTMSRCRFMIYLNFHVTSHLELLVFRVKKIDITFRRQLVSFFRVITSWARCVTLYKPSGLAYFWRGWRVKVMLFLWEMWTHTGV
jgi:hypothetical protein